MQCRVAQRSAVQRRTKSHPVTHHIARTPQDKAVYHGDRTAFDFYHQSGTTSK